MMDSKHEAIVTAAGGKYLGTVEGRVWFNAPSHSTLMLPVPELSEGRVRVKLEVDARKWKLRKAA